MGLERTKYFKTTRVIGEVQHQPFFILVNGKKTPLFCRLGFRFLTENVVHSPPITTVTLSLSLNCFSFYLKKKGRKKLIWHLISEYTVSRTSISEAHLWNCPSPLVSFSIGVATVIILLTVRKTESMLIIA